MRRAANLVEEARIGYYGNPNPHLYSSACWYAHSLGQHLHQTGRPIPTDVRMSRGYSMRVGDMVFSHTDLNGWERVS